MPIYEYSCKKCGKTIEVIQKFSDPILKKHQKCGGTLTKLISQSAFQLKGTGWYVTDYARKGKGGESESSSEKSEKSEKSESSAESSKEKKESAPKSETASKESSKEPAKESSRSAAKKSGKSGE